MDHEMPDKFPIGYLVPEFPSQTHAFFWREVEALEEAGIPVYLISTTRPQPGSCPHNFSDAAQARTNYLFPPRFFSVLSRLATRPWRAARAAGYIIGLRETPVPERLRLLALVPTTMGLVQIAKRHGFGHVHIHSCANAAHLGALAYLLGGLNYSLTLHGDLSVYGTDHRDKMRHARFVSAVTRPLQNVLETEIGHDQAYPLIWMGVDTERFRPADGRESRDPAGPFRVLTVARLNAKKGHVFFLRAMARLCAEGFNIRYRIAGDGPARAEIEKEVSALGLGDRVTFLGSVSEDQVIKFLQESDAGALTSFGMGEAAPVSVMEAMACGVPCIVSVIGGTPDMIDDGIDGLLVPQKDDAGIAEALRKLMTDQALLEQMSRAARHTAMIKFDHRKNALKLYAAIEAAASGSDTP
jgi:glycosyltransferase involved in cell wall biosynthesis